MAVDRASVIVLLNIWKILQLVSPHSCNVPKIGDSGDGAAPVSRDPESRENKKLQAHLCFWEPSACSTVPPHDQ